MEANEKDKEQEVKEEKTETANEKDKDKEQTESTPEDVATFTPTFVEEGETTPLSKRRDLSAIIPQYDGGSPSSQPVLESKETKLKADGAVVIGTFDIKTETATFKEGTAFPELIDIEERKRTRKQERDRKRKNKVEEPGKKKKKKMTFGQNLTALMSLCVICFLLAFYFLYYKKQPGPNEFQVRTVTVELGNKLPLRMMEYVQPARGDTVDEMAFNLDTSKVEIDKVGQYDFTVTHKNLKRSGKIVVQDTTPPNLEIRQVVIVEGEEYTPQQFVSNCTDLSGCNYYFQEADTEEKYKNPGTYSIFITAIDAYNNSIVKQAPLIIEGKGMRLYYHKELPFDFEHNFATVQEYELHFTDVEIINEAIILTGTKTIYYYYDNTSNYQEARDDNYGKINYSFDDSKNLIIYKETVSSVGLNYTRMGDVNDYLTNDEGFTMSETQYERR